MKRVARNATALALVVVSGWAGIGAITDGTSNTRTGAGFGTSPGLRRQSGTSSARHELAVPRKAGKGQQEYLAIPGVRGTGGGAS
jgi:hypothetical protein